MSVGGISKAAQHTGEQRIGRRDIVLGWTWALGSVSAELE